MPITTLSGDVIGDFEARKCERGDKSCEEKK